MKDSCVRKKNKIVFVFSRILSKTYTKGGSMQNFNCDFRLSKAGHRSSYTRRDVGSFSMQYNCTILLSDTGFQTHAWPPVSCLPSPCLLVDTQGLVSGRWWCWYPVSSQGGVSRHDLERALCCRPQCDNIRPQQATLRRLLDP